MIEDTGSPTGSCSQDPLDYSPDPNVTWLRSPSLADAGPDRDKDGAPRNVTVTFTNATINVTAEDETDVFHGGTRTVAFDANDTSASVPAPATPCALLKLPSGTSSLALSADEDGDGVPGKIQLSKAEVCFDLNEEDPEPIIRPVRATAIADLDPDDADTRFPRAILSRQTLSRACT